MQTRLWWRLWWGAAESVFGGSLESDGRFCAGAFGRNLASVAVKMLPHFVKVGSEVLTAVRTKMAFFWVVPPCSLVEVYQRFRGTCCLHHQGDKSHRSDDGGSKDLWNLVNFYQTIRRYNPEDSHLHFIYFIKKFDKFCTFNAIWKDNAAINCILFNTKRVHSRQLWRVILR
jgi:hypothetical protein